MISAVAWVKKGATKELPTRYTHDETLLKSEGDSDEEMEDNRDDLPSMPNVHDAETEAISKKYNLDDYDDEDGEVSFIPPTFHKKGEKDPYLNNDAEEDEDIDDLMIKPSDTVLVAATTEEDQFSHVNVYVYEAEQTNLYIHHDIILPSFPLCIEWMEFHPPAESEDELTGTNNTLAVGTFNPEIEIWDMDLMDALTPVATLGGIEDELEQADDVAGFAKLNAQQRKKKKKKMVQRASERSLKEGSHTDAVMSLSWNSAVPNILASGSADMSVKIWDMNTRKCLNTYQHHQGKVQACCWHPTEPNLLLTSSYDKSAAIMDIRTPSEVYRWKLTADVEKVEWNPHKSQEFLVSTEDGVIQKFDSLAPKDTLFTLHAHDGGVGGLSINKLVPDCLATCSDDKSFKIWDIKDNRPSLIFENDHANAQLFALSWDRNSPNLLAIGGRNHLQVVDLSKVDVITKHFGITPKNK